MDLKRWIIVGASSVALLTAGGIGSAAAGGLSGMASMHDSPVMEQMHDQMPAALVTRCDAMHDLMVGTTGQGPTTGRMMGGGGMMGGPGSLLVG